MSNKYECRLSGVNCFTGNCNVCGKHKTEQARTYSDTSVFVKRFPDGEELYHTSPAFNKVVNCINNGMTFYEAISTLAKYEIETRKQLEKLIARTPIKPIYIVDEKPEDSDKIYVNTPKGICYFSQKELETQRNFDSNNSKK